MQQKMLLTINDAAAAMSVSRSTIYNMLKAGDIKAIRLGAKNRIPVESVQAFIAARQECAEISAQ